MNDLELPAETTTSARLCQSATPSFTQSHSCLTYCLCFTMKLASLSIMKPTVEFYRCHLVLISVPSYLSFVGIAVAQAPQSLHPCRAI